MILKKNVGYVDSIIRVVIGSLIVGIGLYFDSMWGLIGLIPVFSGAVSFCPVYKVLSLDTAKRNVERAN